MIYIFIFSVVNCVVIDQLKLPESYHRYVYPNNLEIPPLEMAIFENDFALVQSLLKSKCRISKMDHFGFSAFHWAIFHKNSKLLFSLLSESENLKDSECLESAIFYAIENNQINMSKELLRKAPRSFDHDRVYHFAESVDFENFEKKLKNLKKKIRKKVEMLKQSPENLRNFVILFKTFCSIYWLKATIFLNPIIPITTPRLKKIFRFVRFYIPKSKKCVEFEPMTAMFSYEFFYFLRNLFINFWSVGIPCFFAGKKLNESLIEDFKVFQNLPMAIRLLFDSILTYSVMSKFQHARLTELALKIFGPSLVSKETGIFLLFFFIGFQSFDDLGFYFLDLLLFLRVYEGIAVCLFNIFAAIFALKIKIPKKLDLKKLKLEILASEKNMLSRFKYKYPRIIRSNLIKKEECAFCLEELDQNPPSLETQNSNSFVKKQKIQNEEKSQNSQKSEKEEVVVWGTCGWHQLHKSCAKILLNENNTWCIVCKKEPDEVINFKDFMKL